MSASLLGHKLIDLMKDLALREAWLMSTLALERKLVSRDSYFLWLNSITKVNNTLGAVVKVFYYMS